MYSVVLATMLTAGAQSTTWCHRAWCHGCHGCHYNAFSVCSGCHSYCSGCYGGCFGGCWCNGVACHGCNGGWRAGCYGCSGCQGCWSNCSGCFASSAGCHCSGAAVEGRARPRADAPGNDAEREAVEDLLRRMREQKKAKQRKREREEDISAPADVVVKLPAQARLWVDDVVCPLTGAERTFKTPALESGQRYVYTLRVEFERDGQRVEEARRVPLAAGQRVEVDFNVRAVRTAAN